MPRRPTLPWQRTKPPGCRSGPALPSFGRTRELPDPPHCPPGWRTGPPDFMVVGAQKAGTTWWFRLITSHPGVHQPEDQRPERHFFDRFSATWPTIDEIERYHHFFPRPSGGLVGEKTPTYMSCYWTPEMIRHAAPDARLIAILRDPIARYVSGRTHEERWLGEILGAGRDWTNDTRWVEAAFTKGLYAQQLAWVRASIPADHLLVLQYERCVADPAAELARTYAFLGLPPHELRPDELARPRNVTRAEKLSLEPQRRALLVQLYRSDVAELTRLVPDLDLALWPDFA